MPKVKASLKNKISEICKKYSDYSRDGELCCNVCAHKITFTHSHGSFTAKSHFESNKHQNLKKTGKIQEIVSVALQRAN